MDLCNIKLTSGEDIVGLVDHQQINGRNVYTVYNPISIYTDPQYGLVANKWLSLSENNNVVLYGKDMFFCHKASDQASDYYYEYIEYATVKKALSGKDMTELEELKDAIMESRKSIKH